MDGTYNQTKPLQYLRGKKEKMISSWDLKAATDSLPLILKYSTDSLPLILKYSIIMIAELFGNPFLPGRLSFVL